MNNLVLSVDSEYLINQSHSELKAKADEKLGILNQSQRPNGLRSGFFSLLDIVVKEASAGNNILGEYPGFFRAMMDDKELYDHFVKEMSAQA